MIGVCNFFYFLSVFLYGNKYIKIKYFGDSDWDLYYYYRKGYSVIVSSYMILNVFKIFLVERVVFNFC